MIELARHIEALLLENDCVIVPGLGGFIAHHTPSQRVAEENLFLPPARTIGFNPQLKMNDGLLIQSIMSATDTGYSDAMRRVEASVQQLITALHEEGKAELPNVGELHYSIRGIYSFVPYDHKLTTPHLYGLDSFEIKELAALRPTAPLPQPAAPVRQPQIQPARRRHRRVQLPSVNLSRISAVAAMVAVVLLSFFFSTPIENTEVIKGNYAQLMPSELFSQIEKQSLLITPIATAQPRKAVKKAINRPIAIKEIKVKEVKEEKIIVPKPTEKVVVKRYHIIVASVGTERDAETMASRLVEQGNPDARPMIGDGKRRVSIASYATHAEATEALKQVRQKTEYQSAWVLKR